MQKAYNQFVSVAFYEFKKGNKIFEIINVKFTESSCTLKPRDQHLRCCQPANEEPPTGFNVLTRLIAHGLIRALLITIRM